MITCVCFELLLAWKLCPRGGKLVASVWITTGSALHAPARRGYQIEYHWKPSGFCLSTACGQPNRFHQSYLLGHGRSTMCWSGTGGCAKKSQSIC
ncbi:unnamed protein product, partial [Amoebophrya sp. A25]|eukprot:GSA25T00009838001.1